MTETVVFFGLAFAWIGPAIWIARDAQRRGANARGWVIGWLIFGLLALVLWLVVRPRWVVGDPDTLTRLSHLERPSYEGMPRAPR